MPRYASTLACLTALTCGCAKAPPAIGQGPLAIRVAAASDLQVVMPKLVEAYRATGGGDVVATFGSSGQLAQQVKQGAPFDAFLSANRGFVASLVKDRAIMPDSVRDYARGSLVLVVREEIADRVKSLADLEGPSIRKVALANPDVAPYGAAARQALRSAGVWDRLEPKRVQAETVRQALQFVQSGNAEAGLVGKAIADSPGLRTLPIEESLYEPLWQAAGITTGSDRKADAERFLQFLTSAQGRSVLRDAGFFVDF